MRGTNDVVNFMHTYFLRHAQCINNARAPNTKPIKNDSLTDLGIQQAKKVKGRFDLILVSPLRRTLDTLYYSQLSADTIQVCDLLREVVCADMGSGKHSIRRDTLDVEKNVPIESEQEVWARIAMLRTLISTKQQKYNRILLISHSCIYGFLTQQGIANAQMVEITI
jgi:broad specificity phosphatase PhoE